MAKPNPFAKFEKSKGDKETANHGKDGSKKEELFDRTQSKPFKPFKVGGMVRRGYNKARGA